MAKERPIRLKREWRRAVLHTVATLIMIVHHVVVLAAYATAVAVTDHFRRRIGGGPGAIAMLLAELWFSFVFLHRLWFEWITREKWHL